MFSKRVVCQTSKKTITYNHKKVKQKFPTSHTPPYHMSVKCCHCQVKKIAFYPPQQPPLTHIFSLAIALLLG